MLVTQSCLHPVRLCSLLESFPIFLACFRLLFFVFRVKCRLLPVRSGFSYTEKFVGKQLYITYHSLLCLGSLRISVSMIAPTKSGIQIPARKLKFRKQTFQIPPHIPHGAMWDVWDDTTCSLMENSPDLESVICKHKCLLTKATPSTHAIVVRERGCGACKTQENKQCRIPCFYWK